MRARTGLLVAAVLVAAGGGGGGAAYLALRGATQRNIEPDVQAEVALAG